MALARANQFEAYKDTEISTANQGKLIVMLYDGAIRFLKIAADNMQPRGYETANTNIIKAQDIVTELMVSLNMEDGGEIAANLFSLYVYLKKRMLEGNINKDAQIIQEVIKLLTDLKTAWEDVARKELARPSAAAGRRSVEEGRSFSIEG